MKSNQSISFTINTHGKAINLKLARYLTKDQADIFTEMGQSLLERLTTLMVNFINISIFMGDPEREKYRKSE